MFYYCKVASTYSPTASENSNGNSAMLLKHYVIIPRNKIHGRFDTFLKQARVKTKRFSPPKQLPAASSVIIALFLSVIEGDISVLLSCTI